MPLDTAGNTLSTARSIALTTTPQIWNEWVGTGDTQDFYKISIAGRSSLTIGVSGLTNNADVQLIRDANSNGIVDSGDVLNSSGQAGTTAESIGTYVDGGTYFIRVYQKSGDTSYDLSVASTLLPADLAGNTLATARSIALNSSSQSWTDYINGGDTQDFYKFTIGARSAVNLAVTGLTNNADLHLIRDTNNNGLIDSGETLSGSGQAGTTNEAILSYLNAGTYFARVYQRSGDTPYTFQASATVLPNDYAGNTIAAAKVLNINPTATVSNDWVGNDDTTDFYQFTLTAQSDISIKLDGLSQNANLKLIDAANVTLNSSNNAGTIADTIVRQLNAGTYYIQVSRDGNSNQTTYNLTTLATPVDTDNTIATARTLTIGSSQTDSLASYDLSDLYRFTLTGNATDTFNVNLGLTGLTGDGNLDLLDNNGLVLNRSNLAGTSNELISRLLGTGTYYLKVWNGGSSTLNYTVNLAANSFTPPTIDWYSTNLKDAGLVSAARIAGSDGELSRGDLITLFRNSEDDNTISADELTDFNTILNSTRWTIGDDVKTLSKKLLSNDKANLTFQGTSLGLLTAGSSSNQMGNLVNKWFFGLDRPTLTSANYSYRAISGSLFQNGISTTDIKQGAVGDCYFLSSLGSIAHEQPNYIQNMFIDNGDNTWTVRFNNSGKWDYVTVDRFLPTNSSGNLVYATTGSNFANASNELWVALAEKAYAQIGESGWTRGLDKTNSYQSIEAGWMSYVINQVTGLSGTWDSAASLTQQTVIDWVNSNKIITLGTGANPGNGLVGGHAYAVTSYNASNGTFFVRNPWATQHVELTWAQLVSSDVDFAYSV